MAKKGYGAEHERMKMLEKEGCKVYRVSGSIGACDLLVVRKKEDGSFEVWQEQVKNCRNKTYYFDEQAKSEWKRLWEDWKRFGIPAYFIIRFSILEKGKKRRKVIWGIRLITEENPPTKIVVDKEWVIAKNR